MELTANAKSMYDFWVYVEGNLAKATFTGPSSANYEKARDLLIAEMKGKKFKCLFGIHGVIFFKKERSCHS